MFSPGKLSPSKPTEPEKVAALSPSRHLLPKKVAITKAEVAKDDTAATTTKSSHIILEFDLHNHPDLFYNIETLQILKTIFPRTKRVSSDAFLLHFKLEQLTKKPWPPTIAGVSCYLSTDMDDEGPTGKLLSTRPRSNVHLLRDIDAQGNHIGCNTAIFHEHISEVFEYFDKIGLKIMQLQNWNDFAVSVLEDARHMNEKFPQTIMRMLCYVLPEKDIYPDREAAPHVKGPKVTHPREYDDGQYEILRSGVVVTCEEFKDGLSHTSTSGVLVQDDSGDKYLIVAADGFPYLGKVHHPRSKINGRVIGNVSRNFLPDLDIAIFKLNACEKFVNETFESADGQSSSRLERLAPIQSLRMGNNISMDSPFMEQCDGQIGCLTYEKQVAVEGEKPSFWTRTVCWIWTGQDSSQLMLDGICGTPVINTDDDDSSSIMGFFRFVGNDIYKDFSYCTAAENLLRGGCTIHRLQE